MQKMYHWGQKSKEIGKIFTNSNTNAYFRESVQKINTFSIKGGRGSRLLI